MTPYSLGTPKNLVTTRTTSHLGLSNSRSLELQEMIDKYATTVNDQGQGGNVYLKLFMSKNGKPCCSVFDPNSAAAQAKREAKAVAAQAAPAPVAESDDLPF